ncbi:MAG: hypothetical protein BGN88_15280 [Clostridiales bacterium 43-6]|nr:MAG: hypothetical protein BGN88_15280 [Clostridiales bacterium 43-6]
MHEVIYVPGAGKLFGDINASDVKIEAAEDPMKVFSNTKQTTSIKESKNLLHHLSGSIHLKWQVDGKLFVNEKK